MSTLALLRPFAYRGSTPFTSSLQNRESRSSVNALSSLAYPITSTSSHYALCRLAIPAEERGIRHCPATSFRVFAMDAETPADKRHIGQVLGPPSPQSDWWDKKLRSGAVVIREHSKNFTSDSKQPGYRMYYYGRDTNMWARGIEPFNTFLPTGRTGMAVSQDGLTFSRYRGNLSGGAIMDPSPDENSFDAVHLGVSDILFDSSTNRWCMYYFGGSFEEVKLSGNLTGDKPFRGVRLRPGMAVSSDGLSFEDRRGPILELGEEGEWDCNGVSWPRVLPPQENGQKWMMTYHTRESGGPKGVGFYSAGVATSDDGKLWQKQGKVLSMGAPGSWDEGGVSVRHVLRVDGHYVMFYEGTNFNFEYSIGLAVSEDGLMWEKDTRAGPEPGGPILKARIGENFWDNMIVGTPYAVAMTDGSFRMYYLGVGKLEGDEVSKQGVGLAISDGANYRSWKRWGE